MATSFSVITILVATVRPGLHYYRICLPLFSWQSAFSKIFYVPLSNGRLIHDGSTRPNSTPGPFSYQTRTEVQAP